MTVWRMEHRDPATGLPCLAYAESVEEVGIILKDTTAALITIVQCEKS